MSKLTKFLLTLSAVASNSSNHTVNTINSRNKNSPGKAKPKDNNSIKDTLTRASNPSATVEHGRCTRCKSDKKFHINQVQTDKSCTMSFCNICNKFYHTPDTCRSKGSVNSVQPVNSQGVVATLSQTISEPTPRIMGTVIQDGLTKGEFPVLPDSGSVAEVMPVSMASELDLSLQAVDPDKYKLASANGSPINVQFESSFNLEISPSKYIQLTCLVSDSLATKDLILSWRAILLLGMLIYPDARAVQSRSAGGVFVVESPPLPGTVSQHSVLSLDNEQGKLPAQNVAFLENPPHPKSFPSIDPTSPN